MAWTTALFGALLLSGLVWIANDIFHLKDQLMETERRFDGMDVQMTALGSRIDDLNISIEQLGAQLLAGRGVVPPATGPDVSVLSSPNTPQNFQAAANAPLETTVADAAAQPLLVQPQQVQPEQVQAQQQQQQVPAQQQVAAVAPAAQPEVTPAQPAVAAAPAVVEQIIAPSPPAPREQLTPEELARPAPVIAAVAPAAAPAPAPAAAAPAAADTQVAAAPAPAPAAAPAASGANLSDDQLLSFNDDQIDPADELLLLDENGNPQ
ncbi:MAG: hypothetical protein AAGA21_00325 [Pseudomonadota bacterium]